MRTPKLGTTLAASILLILIPTTRAHATPDQLLPHGDPKPIPDVGNYHIITNPSPYLNPGTPNPDTQNQNIRFSTPEGYLCTMSFSLDHPADDFSTYCLARHFSGTPQPNFNPFTAPEEKVLYQSIYLNNITGNTNYTEIRKSSLNDTGLQTYLNDLTAFDNGNHTKYPLLQPGNIISLTPPETLQPYKKHNLKPQPAYCTLGYNHTLWCAATAQFNFDGQPIDRSEYENNGKLIGTRTSEPAGFYVTPGEAKWYYMISYPDKPFV